MTKRRRKSSNRNIEDQQLCPESHHTGWQRFLWLIGSIVAIVSLIVVGFQVGKYYGIIKSKRYEFKRHLDYLDQIKSGIRIVSLSCSTNQISPGQTLELNLYIANETQYECELWIGASAVDSSGNEIWNTAQDSWVKISALGVTSIQRFLTFSHDIKLDTYDIQVNLWYGVISDPAQSERVSSASIRKQLRVIETVSPKTKPYKDFNN